MNRSRVVLILTLLCSITAFAKNKNEKQLITIQVVGTDAWAKDHSWYVPGTSGSSTTNCDTSGSANTYGNMTNIDATTTCNTTSTPGSPGYVAHRNIQQESVHAILPDGQHVTLWCQAGFRKCANLLAGSYEAEVDGNALWVHAHQMSGKEMRIKYKLAGAW